MVRNVDSPSKFLMYPWFLQVMINAQVDDLSSHTTKYTSPALTQKVFTNMRRIDDDDEVYVAPTPTSPTYEPLPPPQEPISSPPQALPAPTSSTLQEQPTQPTHTSKSSMTLLNTLMKTCATLTQKVSHLEQDKVAQALEIVKLKQRVKKLERKRRSKHYSLKRLRKEVTVTMAQTLIKMKAEKARILDEQMAKRLQDEEIEQDAAREKHEKKDLERAKVLQQQYGQKQENIDWNVVAEQMQEKHLDNIRRYQNLKEYLDALWRVTKEKFSTTMPTKDKEKVLLIELKRLYEPNAAEGSCDEDLHGGQQAKEQKEFGYILQLKKLDV
nr:hypothetical protein [Tanacetum cinerariifolium]